MSAPGKTWEERMSIKSRMRARQNKQRIEDVYDEDLTPRENWNRRVELMDQECEGLPYYQRHAMFAELREQGSQLDIEEGEAYMSQHPDRYNREWAQQEIDSPGIACACMGGPTCCINRYAYARKLLGIES